MTKTEDIHELRVTLRSGGKDIQAERKPETGAKIPLGRVKDDPLLIKTIRMLIDLLRDNRLKNRNELEILGALLYKTLFDNEIGRTLNRELNDRLVSLLRVELCFEGSQEIDRWPWEYLYCPEEPGKAGSGYFLATRTRLVLTRNLDLDTDFRPILVTDQELPVKILFVAPSPHDPKLDSVQYESLLEDLEKLADNSNGRIKVYKLVEPLNSDQPPKVTMKNFELQVKAIDPHVIHFVGHGQYGEDGGLIAFMGEYGETDWISEKYMANVLRDIFSLRLVFLQACESALRDPYQAVSGLAYRLAHNNIPAVVAMQYKVQQNVAITFARAFYNEIAEGNKIDNAVQKGRSEIAHVIRDLAESRAFGLPVLYMRKSGALLPDQTHTLPIEEGKLVTVAKIHNCPWCGQPMSTTRSRCTECGEWLKCPECKRPIIEAGEKCQACQTQLIICPWCKHACDDVAKICKNCHGSVKCPHNKGDTNRPCNARIYEEMSKCWSCGKSIKPGSIDAE